MTKPASKILSVDQLDALLAPYEERGPATVTPIVSIPVIGISMESKADAVAQACGKSRLQKLASTGRLLAKEQADVDAFTDVIVVEACGVDYTRVTAEDWVVFSETAKFGDGKGFKALKGKLAQKKGVCASKNESTALALRTPTAVAHRAQPHGLATRSGLTHQKTPGDHESASQVANTATGHALRGGTALHHMGARHAHENAAHLAKAASSKETAGSAEHALLLGKHSHHAAMAHHHHEVERSLTALRNQHSGSDAITMKHEQRRFVR